MSMEKIVIGLSDEASERAVDWVIDRAKRGPVEVSLILSFDLVTSDPLADERMLAQAKQRIGNASPASRVTTAMIERSVPESILPATLDADLLVVGAHHRGFFASAIVGTPSVELAARSHCATVIVPEQWTPTSRGTIVVGLEDDGSSGSAIDFAARESIFEKSQLEIVHAWTMPLLGAPVSLLVVDESEMRAVHREDLTAAISRIRSTAPASRVTGFSEEGDPASSALAERGKRADLVVIGSHRRGPLAGLLVGSTAAAMLRTLATPLCIVPPVAPVVVGRAGHEQPTHEQPTVVPV
jgi:nucleotide-binding universal stress UspA family protein